MVLFLEKVGLSEAKGFCSPGEGKSGLMVLTAVTGCVHPECSRVLFTLQVAGGLFLASGLGRPEQCSQGRGC